MIAKILSGTNIELKFGTHDVDLSITGVVAMVLSLYWGDQATVINASDNTLYPLRHKTSDPTVELMREVMNGTRQLILYRLSTVNVKTSTEVSSGITAKAVFPGIHGNSLSIVISAGGEEWLVKTYLGTQEVDSQIISAVVDSSSYYMALSSIETPVAAIIKLTDSTDDAVESDCIEFFAELERREYNVVCSTDSDRAANAVSFVKGQSANKAYVQGVMTSVYPDNENIYVCNSTGGVTADYELTSVESYAILAGLIARAGIVDSLTYCRGVIGWTGTRPRLTRDQQIGRTWNGEVPFVPLYGSPSVLYDTTSLTTFDGDHPKDFGRDLVIHTPQKYQGDLQKLLSAKCVGKIHDSVEGRARIKATVFETVSQNYLAPGYTEDFSVDDIIVTADIEHDAVNAIVGIKTVDTVDKIYVTVTALQGGMKNGKNKIAGYVLRT